MATNVTRIGKYEVIDIIGRGGMGVVYRALDRQLSREVAIKTLTEGFAKDQDMLSRFYQEAAKTGALKHPNIVIVYDLGEQDGFPYIVMEYLPGEPLDKLIRSQRPVSLVFKLKVIEQVCNALGYAHHNDVIHRDVKPGNVIVQADGNAKLLDFGIAIQERPDHRLTRDDHVIGTMHYMAPERLQNKPFDGRSDIFSTGVLLYQLLTSHLPFEGNDLGVVPKILREQHPPIRNYLDEYPPELDGIIDKALAKNPSDRYLAAEEMADDLNSVVEIVKRGQVLELLQQAQELAQREEYLQCRGILQQLLRIDGKHTGARSLLVQVQHKLSSLHRAEQLRDLQSKAEQSLSEKRFSDVIEYLEEALKLDPGSDKLAEMLKNAERAKTAREQVESYLRQADAARQKGDLKSAQVVIAKALEIDKEDSRVRAAYASLLRRMEEIERQAKVQRLLQSVRVEIDARHFTAALEMLGEAERMDPSNPALLALTDAAKAGKAGEQRRRILEQVQIEIDLASTVEQLAKVSKMVEDALARMPSEPMLLNFKLQLAREIREAEIREHVDQVIQRCRALVETSPRDAQDLLTSELQNYPSDERLLSLKASIQSQLSRWTLEQARANYLARAHRAFESQEFPEAIRLLERCQAEGIFSGEISELLEVARREAKQQQWKTERQTILQQAQHMIAADDYEGAIQLLSRSLSGANDPATRQLLEQATNSKNAFENRIAAVVAQLRHLLDLELYDEALRFAHGQPAPILGSQPVQAIMESAQSSSAAEESALRALVEAYAELDHANPKAAWDEIHSAASSCGLPLLQQLVRVFELRCNSRAADTMTLAVQDCHALLRRDPNKAAEVLLNTRAFFPYASKEVQQQWRSARRKAAMRSALNTIGFKASA